ncbi:Ktr system potassium transporter B [Pasteurellaceae bacterium LFhippo2]|nr:Ktr system potassium transporter B [Pasteurellaceae bacterium LFhippo2]
MKIYNSSSKPIYLLVGGFLFFIVLGAMLLKLPSAYSGGELSWVKAFFTATSAVTVTGLSVVDTANFTQFGQVVIMLLIQIGGLGFMTLAIAVIASLGSKIGFGSQQVAYEALGVVPFNMIKETAKFVLLFALLLESISTLILTITWANEKGIAQAFYEGLFLSISAFNNAGFALTAENIIPYVDNIPVNLALTTLIILGGLGFTVVMDIKRNRLWRKFSLNTKIVLSATLVLNLVGFLILFLLETHNPNTLENAGLQQQILASWFQAVTTRTAGFNSLDISQMADASTMIMLLYMFIGGGSLSTASGIKVGTFVILIAATIAFIRHKESATIFKHSISTEQVRKSFVLFMISMILVFVSVFILLIIESKHSFIDVLFEVVSALGTVGLSRGITGDLSPTGEFILMVMMFMGRLGPLTIAYIITIPSHSKLKYPSGNVHIG